jgi:hypothetical protein
MFLRDSIAIVARVLLGDRVACKPRKHHDLNQSNAANWAPQTAVYQQK